MSTTTEQPTGGRHAAEKRASTDQSSDVRSSPLQPTAGRTPAATPAAAPWALLLALAVIVLGAIGIRDALVAAGALRGTSWTKRAADTIDGLSPQTWMIPAGVALALLGLWWLLAALKPRKRTEIALSGDPGAWIRSGDLARLTQPTAENVDGVVSARVSAGRRTVTVKATTTAREATEIRAALADAVEDRLTAMQRAPKVKVNTRYSGGPR